MEQLESRVSLLGCPVIRFAPRVEDTFHRHQRSVLFYLVKRFLSTISTHHKSQRGFVLAEDTIS